MLIKQIYQKNVIFVTISIEKMKENTNLTSYQWNRHGILHRAKVYYENNTERLRLKERDKHRNLSEEEKNKK